jgi:restriction endonuclease Mrr
VFVLLLAVFTTAQAVYFTIEDRKQRECFERQFAESAEVSQTRAALAERESGSERDWQLVLSESAKVVQDKKPSEINQKRVKELQDELVEELLDYKQEIQDIEAERKKNPVPDYAVGSCDDGDNS